MIQKLTFFLLFVNLSIFAQHFEGTITYKIEMKNLNRVPVSDSLWIEKQKEHFGEKGFWMQKYFYKDNKYMSEIETDNGKKMEVFSPKESLIYNWVSKSDSLFTKKSKICNDEFLEIIDSDETKTVLNIKCKCVIVKTRHQKMKIFYNSDYLKIDSELYKWHIYNHLKFIFGKIKCLPLLIEQYGEMGQLVQTATEFNETNVMESKFVIPNLDNIVESKNN